jgi:hypothetical protein
MQLTPATKDQMLSQGFPEAIQTAFENTAETTQCVVLSRVPGGATTELIAAGHDLKGYFIKAKSCDWGPMSGFLCQVPAFNKNGVAGIKHNAEQNLVYYEKFRDRSHAPREGLFDELAPDAKHRIEPLFVNGDDSPFVPLKLTPKVFKRLKDSELKPKIIGEHIACGIAYKKNTNEDKSESFVLLKYIVKRNQDGLYELYHGNIWVYVNKTWQPIYDYCHGIMTERVDEKLLVLGIPTPDSEAGRRVEDLCGTDAEAVVHAITQVQHDDKTLPPGAMSMDDVGLFYPIQGIQNYYPPFHGADSYKNAVTGDYDLFACWPKIPDGNLADLVRQSELVRAGEMARPERFFAKLPLKRHSLQSTVSTNVFVEFIPTSNELHESKRDHPAFGNSNSLVLLVAGTLNAFVNVGEARGGRNVAFHGDEGGRPEIKAVDYDVAAFVPRVLLTKELIGPNQQSPGTAMFIIKSHVELLTLINAVKDQCYVPLNFAWVYDFLKDENAKVTECLKDLLCTQDGDSDITKLKSTFKELFSDDLFHKSAEEKIELVAALQPSK